MADGTYVTVANVRRTCGIGSSEINNADAGDIIAEVEPQIERYFNTVFTPKERIDILDGNGTIRIILDKNPLLGVRELKIDGDTEDPANLHVYRESGKIELDTTTDLTNSTFKEKHQAIIIKYIHGWVEESSTETTTSAASTAGTSVALSVASESGFSANDWIEIYSMDGNKEAAKVSGTSGGVITVDQLVLAHESGSKVVKLQVNNIITKLMNIVCSLAMVARIVGQSYTDIVGYTMGEFSVQKGEPYTQWRETALQLMKERDRLMAMIKPRFYVVV